MIQWEWMETRMNENQSESLMDYDLREHWWPLGF